MPKASLLPWHSLRLLCLGSALILGGCTTQSEAEQAHLSLDATPIAQDLPRYGINLGGPSTWGAEQLRANILHNPGFEPILDRAIVIVAKSDEKQFTDDTDWLAREAGFWDGGQYSIRSGAAAGQGGAILHSDRVASQGAAVFERPGNAGQPNVGDVVSVTAPDRAEAAPGWWRGAGVARSSQDTPPGSQGKQSLSLVGAKGQPASIHHYLDNIAERAGKLLLVNGQWQLSFWARALTPNAQLVVSFDRQGTLPFLQTTLTPTQGWQQITLPFNGNDQGLPGTLTLTLTAQEGEVLVDEVCLGEVKAGAGGFRQVVVDTLRAMNPGYLRDWQGQLGDSLKNRLQPEMSHRPARYRPGNQAQFHYSLPDFMALCAEVGSQPWVVAPTTLDDDEWRALGRNLRQLADRYHFNEVLVEFGNENWNQIFRPGAIPDPARLAATADRGFALLREGFGKDQRLRTILGAQFMWQDNVRQIASASREADIIAVAPYFLYEAKANDTLESLATRMLQEGPEQMQGDLQAARAANKAVNVYEVNLHTTGGDADLAMRNSAVSSAAAGTALARRLIQSTLLGTREQAVYTLSGFDSFIDNGKDLVRLWGVTRDMNAADHLRPTGLALGMMNRVAGGKTQPMRCRGSGCGKVTAIAFDAGQRLAIASSSDTPITISSSIPCTPDATLTLELLDGSDLQRNNETTPQVRVGQSQVRCEAKRLTLSLPPYSLATLRVR